MRKSFDDYRYLAGNRTSGSLWEGPDHLLCVEPEGFLLNFSESYKRIDYNNIQAIAYGRTAAFGWNLAWMLGLMGLLILAVFGNLPDSPVAARIFGGCAALVALLLLIHLVKGPTSRCNLQTAVQVLRLRPLKRMRVTMRVVQRLSELARLHQGGEPLSLEQMELAAARAHLGSHYTGLAKPVFTGSSLLSWGTLAAILAGAAAIAEPFVPGMAFFLVNGALWCTAMGLVVAGMVRALQCEVPESLRFSLWGLTADFVAMMALAFVVYVQAAIDLPRSSNFKPGASLANQLFTWMADADMSRLGWTGWALIGVGGIAILLAVVAIPALFPRVPAASPVPVPPRQPVPSADQSPSAEAALDPADSPPP